MAKPVLEDYQRKCCDFIKDHPKCGVFLDIGYGKTLTTLQAIAELKPRNVLIVAPKAIARTTWHAEVAKWGYGFDVYSMVERYNPKKKALVEIPMKELYPLYQAIAHTHFGTVNLFITTRDRIAHFVEWCDGYGSWPIDMVVCDEFQSFKGGQTQRTKAMRKLAIHTKRIVGLTGTPMPNSLEDIWSEIAILDGGQRLGKYITQFRQNYMHSTMVVNGHAVGWKPNPGAEQAVFSKISDISISVKTDLKLPPLTINDIKIKLSDTELAMYKKFARSRVLDLEDIDKFAAFRTEETVLTPANAAVLAAKLLQIASGTIYDADHNVYEIHNQKLAMTQYIVDNTGGPVLVAYHFQCDEKRLLENIKVGPNEKIVKFDGSDAMKNAWNEGQYKVMLLQPASCCHGLNLQEGGSTLVWYSLPASLEHYEQTNGRLYRKGQTKPVVIHRLIAEDTFDERIAANILVKGMNNESLLEAVRREIEAA